MLDADELELLDEALFWLAEELDELDDELALLDEALEDELELEDIFSVFIPISGTVNVELRVSPLPDILKFSILKAKSSSFSSEYIKFLIAI